MGKTIHKIRKKAFNKIRNLKGSTNLREGGSDWARLLIFWSSLTLGNRL